MLPRVHPDHLGDEDGRHGLVERSAVHVDGGADGEDESSDPGLYLAALLQAGHRHRQRGRAARRPEGCGQGGAHLRKDMRSLLRGFMAESHLPNEFEWKRSGGDGVDERQDDEPVEGDAQGDGDEVPGQLGELGHDGLHVQDLPGDQERDADGGEVDHPVGDPHHHVGHRLEERQERLALLPRKS